MVYFFALAALAAIPAAIAQNTGGLMINTPTGVVQCQPAQLSWTGGTAPFFLSFIPAGQPSAPAIKQFPNQNGNSFTWTADLASGSSFSISLKDSSGNQAFSDIVNVQSGPDSSCINTSITEGGTGGAAAPTSGGGSSSGAPASTTGAPASSGGSSSGGSSAASSKPASGSSSASATGSAAASATTSAKPNAASNNKGNALVVAGVMGLVGAALF